MGYSSSSRDLSGAALTAALTRLSRLQQLSLSCERDTVDTQASCLAGIQRLTQLTSLNISGGWSHFQQQLPQLIQPLVLLRHLHLTTSGHHSMDLSNLTQLESLSFHNEGLPEDLVLPSQLTVLSLGDCHADLDVAPLLPLQQLQRLQYGVVASESAPQLQQLAKSLPAVQHISLQYYEAWDAASAADVWPQLAALQDLTLDCENYTPTPSQME
jgi:hypothetical protein